MTVILPAQNPRSKNDRSTSPKPPTATREAWKILGWLGSAYFVMSILDLALGWFPVRFGTPEWEFGTISATIAGLALPSLALYLMLGSAIAREQPNISRALAWLMIVLAVALAALGLFYLTSVPLALRAVANNELVHLGMKKSIFKSLMLFVGYEILYVLGAREGLRRRRND